jgi:hypothetical protein
LVWLVAVAPLIAGIVDTTFKSTVCGSSTPIGFSPKNSTSTLISGFRKPTESPSRSAGNWTWS